MKIVYYSGIAFTDCDFPLIKEYQKENETYYFIPLLYNRLSGSLIDIKKQIKQSGIFSSKVYEEFKKYSNYFDLSKVFIVNRSNKGMSIATFLLYIKLVFKLIKINPDVVHITHPLWGPEILLYVFYYKMVLTVHDPFLHAGETGGTKELQRKIAFKLVRKLLLLNTTQKEDFIKQYHLNRKKIGISKLSEYESLRFSEEKKIDVNTPYVLFFGRISPYKGIEYLCESMKIVHKEIPNLHCIIAGNGKMYFDYSSYKNESYITFINRYITTSELVFLLHNSLFSICPYTDATQSGVVFSSFAFKKPVIASDVGALNKAIINGKTGLLIEPRNSVQLSEAIIKLVKNEKMVNEMSKNIEKLYFEGGNSWESIKNDNIKFYQQ